MKTAVSEGSGMKAVFFTVKFIIISFVICAAALLLNLAAAKYAPKMLGGFMDTAAKAESETARWPMVIIDAGHGGMDGGAVGISGVYEKDLNLQISFILYDMLRANGVPAVMTRTEDRMLYTESQDIKGQRKMYDLKNRILVGHQNPGAFFVSIHMNKFPQSRYSGLQIYYSPNDAASLPLAERVRTYNKTYNQPDNSREVKKSNSNIYILHHIKNPAILIECGFLSNPGECALLVGEDYQKKLAAVIFSAIMNYLAENPVQGG